MGHMNKFSLRWLTAKYPSACTGPAFPLKRAKSCTSRIVKGQGFWWSANRMCCAACGEIERTAMSSGFVVRVTTVDGPRYLANENGANVLVADKTNAKRFTHDIDLGAMNRTTSELGGAAWQKEF